MKMLASLAALLLAPLPIATAHAYSAGASASALTQGPLCVWRGEGEVLTRRLDRVSEAVLAATVVDVAVEGESTATPADGDDSDADDG